MIRGKILMAVLVATGVLAALMGLAQMWFEPFVWDVFVKSLITLLIVGVLTSFLAAVNYDMPGSRARLFLILLVVLAIVGAGLIVTQLWWEPFKALMFGKMIVTVIILAGLASFILAVSEDLGTTGKLKKDKFID